MCSLSLKPVLATSRLTLRPLAVNDADRIAEQANDYGVASMTLRMPHPYQRKDAESFLAALEDPLGKDHAAFGIDTDDDGLIGVLGFHRHQSGAPELGYWLGRDHWGKGYATEAVRAALRWARLEWGKKLIFAGHAPENTASAGVLIKNGFLYTGDVLEQFSVARGGPSATRMMVWLA